MRIGIDAMPIFGSRGGVGWHTYHLLHALAKLKEDVKFVGYVGPGALQRYASDPEIQVLRSFPSIEWVETAKLAWRWRGRWDKLDLFHGVNYRMQTEGRYGGVVTIHDCWLDRHPEYSPKLFGQRRSFLRTRRTVRRARAVITISEFSRGEIVDVYGSPPGRLVVIPNGVSERLTPVDRADAQPLLQRMALEGRYMLFVGGADPRKNHRVCLEAYASRREQFRKWKLVAIGGCSHRLGDIRATARALGIEEALVCAGHLSFTELHVLYGCADVMVFPSLYEGFGLPVLEAMACGTPVITSNTSALPEVAGDAAVLVDPLSVSGLADALTSVLHDDRLRQDLRRKGLERVRSFSWEKSAANTLALYRSLCQESSTAA